MARHYPFAGRVSLRWRPESKGKPSSSYEHAICWLLCGCGTALADMCKERSKGVFFYRSFDINPFADRPEIIKSHLENRIEFACKQLDQINPVVVNTWLLDPLHYTGNIYPVVSRQLARFKFIRQPSDLNVMHARVHLAHKSSQHKQNDASLTTTATATARATATKMTTAM